MDIRFDGKTVLVTGAGKGIGRQLTLKLVETGANVIAISRTQSDLESLKNENPEKIHILCLDIGDWESTKRALENIETVDLLVNNAAILEPKEIGSISEEEVDRHVNINMKSIINITQLVANEMKSRGKGGSIVNVSSVVGIYAVSNYSVYAATKGAVQALTISMALEFGPYQLVANEMKSRGKGGSIVNVSSVVGIYAVSNYSVYAATKGAVQALTISMALEFGPYQIRVNTVNPTATRTPMAEKVGFFEEGNEFAKAIMTRTPLRRIAEPEDIVYPILFLLSDYSSMITGVTLPVDGGLGVCFV